jgi:type IX secretion system PorP/SprF family membrane protein
MPFLKRILLVFILFIPEMVSGQDPQLSQFYSAPLYLNPAFAGSSQLTRVGANYRSQWPSLEASYVTYMAWADHFIDDKNSGIGFLVGRDNVTISGLTTTSIVGEYAYQLPISELYTLRVGFSAGYSLRNIDYSTLVFGDQIGPNGQILPTTGETFDQSGAKNYFDLGSGALLYSKSAWLGVSVFHLNTPNQTLIGGSNPLPRKYSFHLGYKFFWKPGTVGQGLFARPQERSVAPTIQYKFQGEFDQLDLGLYFTYDPVIFGIWYRGLPVKTLGSFSNNEALVFLFGFSKRTDDEIFNIGYSYDLTLSNLGSSSGGAHEFSISYSWFTGDPRKPPKNVRMIPCPNF